MEMGLSRGLHGVRLYRIRYNIRSTFYWCLYDAVLGSQPGCRFLMITLSPGGASFEQP